MMYNVFMNEKQQPEKRITLRMAFELWQEVKAIAKQEKRSLNAQIVYIIQEWFKERGEGNG